MKEEEKVKAAVKEVSIEETVEAIKKSVEAEFFRDKTINNLEAMTGAVSILMGDRRLLQKKLLVLKKMGLVDENYDPILDKLKLAV